MVPLRLAAALAAAALAAAGTSPHPVAAATFRAPDLVGTYTLTEALVAPTPPPQAADASPPPACATTITHREFNALTNETFSSVPFDALRVNGEDCEDSKTSATDKLFCVAAGAAVANAAEVSIPSGLLSVLTASAGKFLGAEVRALIDRARATGDGVLLCVDGQERECGDDFTSPANAAYLLLRVDETVTVADPRGADRDPLFTLSPGRRHMVALRPEVACVYDAPEREGGGEEGVPTSAPSTFDRATTCFPGDATVALPGGGGVRMDALRVGDVVADGPGGSTSPVVGWSHADAAGVAPLVVVTTSDGRVLALTPGHYLPLGGAEAATDGRCTRYGGRCLVPARRLVLGDTLAAMSVTAASTCGAGAGTPVPATVTRLSSSVTTSGVYAPHTASGWLIVDGVLVSAYTEALPPAVAHAATGVLRAAAGVGGGWASAVVGGGVLRAAGVGGWLLGALGAHS